MSAMYPRRTVTRLPFDLQVRIIAPSHPYFAQSTQNLNLPVR